VAAKFSDELERLRKNAQLTPDALIARLGQHEELLWCGGGSGTRATSISLEAADLTGDGVRNALRECASGRKPSGTDADVGAAYDLFVSVSQLLSTEVSAFADAYINCRKQESAKNRTRASTSLVARLADSSCSSGVASGGECKPGETDPPQLGKTVPVPPEKPSWLKVLIGKIWDKITLGKAGSTDPYANQPASADQGTRWYCVDEVMDCTSSCYGDAMAATMKARVQKEKQPACDPRARTTPDSSACIPMRVSPKKWTEADIQRAWQYGCEQRERVADLGAIIAGQCPNGPPAKGIFQKPSTCSDPRAMCTDEQALRPTPTLGRGAPGSGGAPGGRGTNSRLTP
jgi:hypothetical protein